VATARKAAAASARAAKALPATARTAKAAPAAKLLAKSSGRAAGARAASALATAPRKSSRPGAASPSDTAAREAMTKVSVSMPEQTAQAAREMAGPGRFSAYVADAVQRRLELDRLAELVAGIEERLGGPIPEDVMAQVDAAWHGE
jgi:hypothetical protein